MDTDFQHYIPLNVKANLVLSPDNKWITEREHLKANTQRPFTYIIVARRLYGDKGVKVFSPVEITLY